MTELFLLGVLSFTVGIFSGLIGIGGGILIIPSLLFVYPLVTGQPSMGIAQATGLSAVQSLTGSLASVAMHHKKGNAHMGVVLMLGGATILGAVAGGLLTDRFSEKFMTWLYVVVLAGMLIYSIADRRRGTATEEESLPRDLPLAQIPNKTAACTLSLGIGFLSGLMGIGGAVLLIPLMNNLMKLPLRLTIGCSSGIIFITSIGTVVGKWLGHLLNPAEAVVVAIGAIGGGYIGAWLSHKASERVLFWLLMGVIATTLLRMAIDLYGLYR